MWSKKLHRFIFAIALSELHLLWQFWHIYTSINFLSSVYWIFFIARDGEQEVLKVCLQQANTPCTHNHRAALLRDAGLQLYHPTCDFITFQILLRKLQNLGSARHLLTLSTCLLYRRSLATIFTLSCSFYAVLIKRVWMNEWMTAWSLNSRCICLTVILLYKDSY